jgi:hypothetical protein
MHDINPSANWSIVPVPATVADDSIGIVAGSSINQLLLSDLPTANKVAILTVCLRL